MDTNFRGILLTAVSAAGFGSLAILTRVAFAGGADFITIGAVRFTLAALCFWGIVVLSRQDARKDRGLNRRLTPRQVAAVFLMGAAGYTLMSALFSLAVEIVPAPLAALLLYTYPALVTLISRLAGHEPLTLNKLAALGLSSAGLLMVLGFTTAGANPAGLLIGLGAALVYSVYIVIGGRLLRDITPFDTATWVTTGAACSYLIAMLAGPGLPTGLTLTAWAAMAGTAILATVVAVLAFFGGISLIGASRASIISTLEPIVTVILAAVFLDETLSWIEFGGGALILSGVVALEIGRSRSKPQPEGNPQPQNDPLSVPVSSAMIKTAFRSGSSDPR